MSVPAVRVRVANDRPEHARGDYVLLWTTAARRTRRSFALDHAVARAKAAGRPLLVLEALRVGYRWASDRMHRFVLDGMAENAARLADLGVGHHAYVEPTPGAGKGLLAALAAHAVVVVADDSPAFFLPHMLAAAARQVPVRLEAVDGVGVVPLAATPHAFPTAHAFRRWLQKHLPEHLASVPAADPLARADVGGAGVPRAVLSRWPRASRALLEGRPEALAALPIDHAVPPAPTRGGETAARAALRRFVAERLPRYGEERNDPDAEAASGLSPWLHFGHLSAHDVVLAVLAAEGRAPADLVAGGDGSREGWWGCSPAAEAFLDQVVTWRELGHVFGHHRPDEQEAWSSLPEWAQRTLAAHARDPRPVRYDLATLEAARTHDEVWNAAQRELVGEGRMHNYLRMLWAKKLLEWSATPQEALEVAFHLNHRWALDGRDPNSASGVCWTFGRFDRPWAPERLIFGTVRYMSSANTKKKLDLARYLARWGPAAAQGDLGFA